MEVKVWRCVFLCYIPVYYRIIFILDYIYNILYGTIRIFEYLVLLEYW